MFVIESGYGTSNLARNFNNYLGMKYPNVRSTIAIGKTKHGFSIYSSMRQCFIDFRIYQLTYMNNMDKQQTIRYLRNVYSKDKNYLYKTLGY